MFPDSVATVSFAGSGFALHNPSGSFGKSQATPPSLARGGLYLSALRSHHIFPKRRVVPGAPPRWWGQPPRFDRSQDLVVGCIHGKRRGRLYVNILTGRLGLWITHLYVSTSMKVSLQGRQMVRRNCRHIFRHCCPNVIGIDSTGYRK